MATRTKSKVSPKYKTKYRVKNWPIYEAALRKRGDITAWFDEDAIDTWNAAPSGRPGGQRRYSDLSIVTALTLRVVFHLVIDSTGLKMVGDEQWHAFKHNTSNKRRSWRKLHLGVNGDGFIVASQLTEGRATSVAERVGRPSAGPSREWHVPIQAHHRGRAPGQEVRDAGIHAEPEPCTTPFDILGLEEDARERDIERAMMRHLKDTLVELGVGSVPIASVTTSRAVAPRESSLPFGRWIDEA